MADAGPDYAVERKRLEFAKREHEITIRKGKARLEEIEDQKALNLARAELSNAELDSETGKIRQNEDSLNTTIKDIDTRLKAMVPKSEG